MEAARPGWIGSPPTPAQIFGLMLVGVTGIMIAGLQPLLLGALAQEGRIDAAQIGRAATAELLTMGAAAGLAGAVLKPVRLKLVAMLALAALAATDALTPSVRGEMVTVTRAVAGAPSGVLVWLTICLIARSPTPERWSGAYLTIQTLAQFLLAGALTVAVVPRFGANGGFLALAAFCVGNAALAFLLPSQLAPLPVTAGESGGALPGLRGWAALAASFLFVAFEIGVWVYAEPLSRQAGHAPAVVGQAVSLSLGCQVAGGLAATVLAGRLNWLAVMLVCLVIDLALLTGFAALPRASMFLVLSGLFGFLWIFASPFLVPMTIKADPTRRAAVLMGGAQLLGGSFGPLIASAFVSDADARGALAFGAAALVVAVGIMVVLSRTHPRPTAVSAEVWR